ncbi:hypothetical protein FGW37_05395 [Streptomyces rectiverticillatus]|uniref:hypothetical protein n=1 Tax=Streptomyces rectiverticillatus TaxID=173860 RepID=UPI0015C3F826|nr:hypothetical protein [Streptomyces rectiverticillatus]QLE71111.1 hypothetical protein FGW37_05395 [Streptomyces rectiverticillatus]
MAKPGRSLLLAALDEPSAWSITDHLTARISDALELSNFLFIKANSSDADDLAPPEPIRRPGHVEPPEPKPEFATGEQLSAFMANMSNL